MKSSQYRQRIQDSGKKIAALQADRAKTTQKLAKLQHDINRVRSSLKNTSNSTSINSKLREIGRYETQIADCHKAIASIEGRLGKEEYRRTQLQKDLMTAEVREERQKQEEQKKNERRNQTQIRSLSDQVTQHTVLHEEAFTMIEKLQALPEEIVVLFLAANPVASSHLRLDEEVRSITEMIRKAEYRDSVKLVSRWAVRPLDLLQAINEDKPHVIHFSGHGSEEGLLFQDDGGGSKIVATEAMVQVLASASSDLRLVVFNSCESSAQASAVVEHVEAAVGMNQSIRDDAARVFAAQFYSAIGFGLSIEVAFAQAKSALLLEGIPQSDVPELHIRSGLEARNILLVQPTGTSRVVS